jgi:hypothetical protein
MKKLAVLLAVLLLTLVAAVPVAAAPPVVETGSFDDIYEVADPVPLCPGIVVMNRSVGTYRDTWFYDNQGNLLRYQSSWSGVDNLYNAANPGFKLSGHFSAHYFVNYVTGEESAPGTFWSITVPGYGIVFKEAGLWKSRTDRLVGIHTSLDPEKMALLCSLLGSQ